ncbi:MAG: hypothetical protein JNM82_12535 [Rhodocyclaceae bacterium]|nr:hypothetical protein [Rhodocyclaceae bacterium]
MVKPKNGIFFRCDKYLALTSQENSENFYSYKSMGIKTKPKVISEEEMGRGGANRAEELITVNSNLKWRNKTREEKQARWEDGRDDLECLDGNQAQEAPPHPVNG